MTKTKLDPYKVYRQLEGILPELAKIVAYDFERFETCRRDTLEGYARVFDKLLVILLKMPSETQLEAIKVIEDYIAGIQNGDRHNADWLAFMLREIIEAAERRQKRKTRLNPMFETIAEWTKKRVRQRGQKPLADDELPF
jgi:hypothetical protein